MLHSTRQQYLSSRASPLQGSRMTIRSRPTIAFELSPEWIDLRALWLRLMEPSTFERACDAPEIATMNHRLVVFELPGRGRRTPAGHRSPADRLWQRRRWDGRGVQGASAPHRCLASSAAMADSCGPRKIIPSSFNSLRSSGFSDAWPLHSHRATYHTS